MTQVLTSHYIYDLAQRGTKSGRDRVSANNGINCSQPNLIDLWLPSLRQSSRVGTSGRLAYALASLSAMFNRFACPSSA